MNNYEVVVAKTNDGYLELVAVEYEQIGKVRKPTQKAEEFLKRFSSRNNITQAVKYNLDLQDQLKDVFGWAL